MRGRLVARRVGIVTWLEVGGWRARARDLTSSYHHRPPIRSDAKAHVGGAKLTLVGSEQTHVGGAKKVSAGMASEHLPRLGKVDHQGRSGEHEAALGQHRIEQHPKTDFEDEKTGPREGGSSRTRNGFG